MKKQFTTRIEQDILDKVKSIAEYERRTLNNTVEYLLAMAVKDYEDKHGINPPE